MTSWNQILTRTGSYKVRQSTAAGGNYLRVTDAVPPSTERWFELAPAASANTFQFDECNGGCFYARLNPTGEYLRYDATDQRWEPVYGRATATKLALADLGGKVNLRCAATENLCAPSGGTGFVLATANPPTVEAEWVLEEESGPAASDTRERWLSTYDPDNRCSPGVFLAALSAANELRPSSEQAAKADLTAKIDWWNGQFSASDSPTREQGRDVMRAAANKFFKPKTPENEFNELDPDAPPEWSDIDTELGRDPYPPEEPPPEPAPAPQAHRRGPKEDRERGKGHGKGHGKGDDGKHGKGHR